MKRLFVPIVIALALTSLVIDPAAPGQKVSFPEKRRPISFIVPFAPGGATDVCARMVAPAMEKELETPVQVINRPGGGSQVGNTANISTFAVVPGSEWYANDLKDFAPRAGFSWDIFGKGKTILRLPVRHLGVSPLEDLLSLSPEWKNKCR
jgi:hypothetical protein